MITGDNMFDINTTSLSFAFDTITFKLHILIYSWKLKYNYLLVLFMTSVELRKLNAYPEWRDNDKIIAVTDYVEALQNNNPNPPIDAQIYPTQRQRQRFIQKFQEGFSVVLPNPNQRVLYYRPTEQPNQPSRINLRVTLTNQHQAVLNANYNSEVDGYNT